MKHIDICEENPFDAVKTNVIGTSNMLEASILAGVSKFVNERNFKNDLDIDFVKKQISKESN